MKTPEETMEIARRMGMVDLYSAVFVFDAKHQPLLSRMYREKSLSRVALGPMSYLMRVVNLDATKGYLHVVMQPILSQCCKVPIHEAVVEPHAPHDDGAIYARCGSCGKLGEVKEYETKT